LLRPLFAFLSELPLEKINVTNLTAPIMELQRQEVGEIETAFQEQLQRCTAVAECNIKGDSLSVSSLLKLLFCLSSFFFQMT
jgi:hypothetical protein